MTAPLLHPVVPAASVRQEIAPEAAATQSNFGFRAENQQVAPVEVAPVVFIDLDYLDAHKVATDSRFAIRDGLNERRW